MAACAILVGAVGLLQGLNDLAVVDVARMRAALVATVAMSVVSVTMDSMLAVGITVSQTCVNCVLEVKCEDDEQWVEVMTGPRANLTAWGGCLQASAMQLLWLSAAVSVCLRVHQSLAPHRMAR